MMMMCENQTPQGSPSQGGGSSGGSISQPNSSQNTPNFVRKFQKNCPNFRPLDLRKLHLNGSQAQIAPTGNGPSVGHDLNGHKNGHGNGNGGTFLRSQSTTSTTTSTTNGHLGHNGHSLVNSTGSLSPFSSRSSSQDSSPKLGKNFGHFSSCYASHSQDSYMRHALKRQGSQSRLRESLLASLLSPRTKEIDFIVPPQSLSPLTPTFGQRKNNSGESSPAGSLSGSRSETDYTSRANTPSPIFFRNSNSEISGSSGHVGGINPELYKLKPESEEESDLADFPESSSQRRIWFSLEYDSNSERLLVTLIKARNLPVKYYDDTVESEINDRKIKNSAEDNESSNYLNKNKNGETGGGHQTCFVRASLNPDERRTLQSKPRKMTKCPKFDETFGFQVSHKALDERSLKLCIYEVEDENKRHKMIGYIIQPLKDIDWSFGKQTFKEDLLRDIGELSPNIGEVLISLCYNSSIPRLTVSVFEVKGIKSRESSSGSYAKISLNQNTKILKTKKTATVPLVGGHSSFNESFNFKLPSESLDVASISIQLMYSQPGYNKDQPIGRIVLGSFMFARGKGLDHWQEMLARPKEKVTFWHACSE